MSILVTECVNDIFARVKLVSNFAAGEVRLVYSETDLLDKAKFIPPPFAGVMYEGLRSNNTDGGKMGRATDCYVTIILGALSKAIGGHDSMPQSVVLLDAIRDQILNDRSPTKHRWKFISELYTGDIGNTMIYIQRWSTPFILSR